MRDERVGRVDGIGEEGEGGWEGIKESEGGSRERSWG